MLFPRALFYGLVLFAAAAAAQSDKPGPMQSGTHAQPDTGKPRTSEGAPAAQPGTPPAADFDVQQLFATTCGWCHLKGGRVAGKGPQLMGTDKTDAEIATRVRNGKTGQMPAFGATFNDDQMKAIITYIRGLKP
jgi:mono/diheme cytochrome c family protein